MNYSTFALAMLALAVASVLAHARLIERRRGNRLRGAWRIAQDVVIERETAGDRLGAIVADEICARIEKELGL